MKSFNINLQNCHGISLVKNEFKFDKSNLIILYAPNGTMKTSFANTFKDLAQGISPKNKVFKDLEPIHKIKIDKEVQNQEDIKNRIFVIESMDKEFDFLETAPLISNVEKRKEYSEIFKDINDLKLDLLKKIKNLAKIRGRLGKPSNLETQIMNDFGYPSNDDILDLLLEIEFLDDVDDFSNFKYSDLFNEKVDKFLKTPKVQEEIGEFRDNLERLIESSTIFNEEFNYNNADALYKSISKNNLFKANHIIKFNSVESPITELEELKNLLDSEIAKIFNDDTLAIDEFKNFNNKFKNQETKTFQTLIKNNPFLMVELDDMDKFKRNYWMSIFKILENDIKILLEEFDSKKETLKEIEKEAQEEETLWNKVVDLFNTRFTVPFTLTIGNKKGVILKDSIPEIKFLYKKGDMEEEVSLEDLKEFCSAGQLRALYLLDVIYKIKLIEDIDDPKLLIIDDIADSFDYQNKYAIIEYINDLESSGAFRIILLTHNYDFFRTVSGRIHDSYELFAIKTPNKIHLSKRGMDKDIFKHFRGRIKDAINKDKEIEAYKFFISTLPFMRNLYEYKPGNKEQDKLTKVLHYKTDATEMKLKDLEEICEEWGIIVPPYDKRVYDAIEETAVEISKFINETKLNIENKIVLSIAIRIEAEMHMLDRLGKSSTDDIKKEQTRELFNKYKEAFSDDENIALFEKVNMMTPQNIHVNSFMYEPILDMDDASLKKLYHDIRKLNSKI